MYNIGQHCCDENHQRLATTTDNCFMIKVPTNDRFYSHFHKTCISMFRTKNTDDIHCNVGPILPVNPRTFKIL